MRLPCELLRPLRPVWFSPSKPADLHDSLDHYSVRRDLPRHSNDPKGAAFRLRTEDLRDLRDHRRSRYLQGERCGLDSAKWSLQLYINNLTDERAVLFANPYEFDYFFDRSRVTVNRPREFGVRWIQRFGG